MKYALLHLVDNSASVKLISVDMSSICSVESLSSSHPVGSKDRSLIGSLQADWRSMFYHENSKDISVIIEDGQCIRLHSLVLLARCGNNGRLQYETSSQINCRHLQASSVKKILLYLYSAEVVCLCSA